MFHYGMGDHEGRRQRRQHKRERVAAILAASGRGPFGRHFGDNPFGQGFGDGGERRRRGRLLGQGDIRILVLSLIEQEPRHGYEIIKAIEEMSFGFYVPSPGVIYPTLTYLEEAGYVVAEPDGNKKRYSITEEGKAFLAEQQSTVTLLLARLKEFSEKVQRRETRRSESEEGPELPRSVEAAFLNLREAVSEELKANPEASTKLVQKLLSLASDLK